MKKNSLFNAAVILLSLVFASMSFAGSPEEVLKALKKLKASCDAGINYTDYTRSISDIEYEAGEYADSYRNKPKNLEFNSEIIGARVDYNFAALAWRWKIMLRESFFYEKGDMWKTFKEIYKDETLTKGKTQLFYMDVISYAWSEAAKHVTRANEILNGE